MSNFFRIDTIDDILSIIQGKDEFIVVDKGDYKVINYVYTTNNTFDDKRLIECRGLIFAKNGSILSRRYHKFFNVGEKEETHPSKIDLSKPHVILEKLDGSMVSSTIINDKVVWMSKMGITDISEQVERFVLDKPQYGKLAQDCVRLDLTPIYEWCSEENRVVIGHSENKLVLTGIRHNRIGRYVLYGSLRLIGKSYNIPLVNQFEAEGKETETLLDYIKKLEDIEGIVIRFLNGEMYKIKASWYVRIHRAKSFLDSDRAMVEIILNDGLDDILPILPENDRTKALKFNDEFWVNVEKFVSLIHPVMQETRDMSRKEVALSEHLLLSDPLNKSIIFKCWNKPEDVRAYVIEILKKKCSSNKGLEQVCAIWK